MGELITMSQHELNRLEVFQKLLEKRLKQSQAAEILHLSIRQIKRLFATFKNQGAEALTSKRRGKPSNHTLVPELKQQALDLICKYYRDFGPTLATEKLLEVHQIKISVETVRQMMITADLWKTRSQKLKRAYQPRYRRACYGELIQIDGSEHAWFEDRNGKCTLLVYIDDATSELMQLKFVPEESTFSYFEATKEYLLKHGKPITFYSDKFSVFRVNQENKKDKGDRITQFGRALTELNIDNICANTCEAKGRVERANKTLQDRLVKELRLQGISTMQAANLFATELIQNHNRKFRKAPLSNTNVHRPLQPHEQKNLNDILSWQEERTVSNSLTLQYDKVLYMLQDTLETRQLKRKAVTIYDYSNGEIKIKYQGRDLPYRIFDKLRQVESGDIIENKRLGHVLKYIKEQQEQLPRHRSASCPSRSYSIS